ADLRRPHSPFPATRGPCADSPGPGPGALGSRAVTRVASAAGRLLVRLVAEMLGQLRRHRALHKPLGQPGEHTARPDDLLLRPGAGKQLVDHLIGKTITHRVRDRERRTARRAPRPPPPRAPPALPISSSDSVLAFVDMTLLFGHAYTADRTLPSAIQAIALYGSATWRESGSSRWCSRQAGETGAPELNSRRSVCWAPTL